MVLDVQPIAHTVCRRRKPAGVLPSNAFRIISGSIFGKLVRAVIVGAVCQVTEDRSVQIGRTRWSLDALEAEYGELGA